MRICRWIVLGLVFAFPLSAAELHVTPEGKPDAAGTKEAPLDLVTTLTKPGAAKAGDTVWVHAGTYKIGTVKQDAGVCGTKDQPLVFRAALGERATIEGGIEIFGDYTSMWGLEITGSAGSAIETRKGDGLRFINLVLHDNGTPLKEGEKKHPTGMGIGAWDVGNDHEMYGNIIYRNGCNSLDHGIYSQNTAKHTAKKYLDNIMFENAGSNIQIYGQNPILSGFDVEGNICYAASLHPKFTIQGQMSIIVGGTNPISNVVLKNNCTYHPKPDSKRGMDVGYTAKGNRNIVVEDNYFTGGLNAMEIKGAVGDLTVRNNTFWAPAGMVKITWGENPDKAKVQWDGNTYLANGKFDLEAWRKETGFDKESKLVEGKDGRPTGLFVFKRVNKYEPERVHFAVYNWDQKPEVEIDVAGLAAPGSKYRIVNALDWFGEPVAKGEVAGKTIALPMKGHTYEPEFGAYVLFREVPKN